MSRSLRKYSVDITVKDCLTCIEMLATSAAGAKRKVKDSFAAYGDDLVVGRAVLLRDFKTDYVSKTAPLPLTGAAKVLIVGMTARRQIVCSGRYDFDTKAYRVVWGAKKFTVKMKRVDLEQMFADGGCAEVVEMQSNDFWTHRAENGEAKPLK